MQQQVTQMHNKKVTSLRRVGLIVTAAPLFQEVVVSGGYVLSPMYLA